MSDKRRLDVSGALFYIEVQVCNIIISKESTNFKRDIKLNWKRRKIYKLQGYIFWFYKYWISCISMLQLFDNDTFINIE